MHDQSTENSAYAGESKRWAVVAAFFEPRKSSIRWLDDFISDPAYSFIKIRRSGRIVDWHHKKGRVTGINAWFGHMAQVWQAYKTCPYGMVTCFPQLAICAGLWKRVSSRNTKIIAFHFNLGAFPDGFRRWLSQFAAQAIDIFVVHSPSEIQPYANYLGVEESRVRFVPLQRRLPPINRVEEQEQPFILAMGSAGRDYKTLLTAVQRLGIRTIIVSRNDILAELEPQPHVEMISGLSQKECLELLASARILVTPVANLTTASGQVTIVNALRMGVPTVSTRCPGTDGYVLHGLNGILVEPNDAQGLASEIERLWFDTHAREELATNASEDAAKRFSDEAAAEILRQLLTELDKPQQRSPSDFV